MSKYITKMFGREILKQLAAEDSVEGYEVLVDDLIDSSRWSLHYYMVFKYEDKCYSTFYCRGATESQYESPYEHDDDTIACTQVAPVEVVSIDYLPVEASCPSLLVVNRVLN